MEGGEGALLSLWVLYSAISLSERPLPMLPSPQPRSPPQPPVLCWAEQEVIGPARWEGVLYILFYQISLGNFMNYELSTPFSTAIE